MDYIVQIKFSCDDPFNVNAIMDVFNVIMPYAFNNVEMTVDTIEHTTEDLKDET